MTDGWKIQDSTLVLESPDVVSRAGYVADQWTDTKVPATVLGALISSGAYSFDPFYSKNLMLLPGSGPYYVWGKNFARVETPPESPFGRPWYFRTEFKVDNQSPRKFAELEFKGITYGADIWINGHRLANASDNAGTYRTPHFDITPFLQPGTNAVLAAVHPPKPDDLTADWVDWNHTPQDKNMGLWQDVLLKTHGSVSLEHPFVNTHLTAKQVAQLTVKVDVVNISDKPVRGVLHGEIEGDVSRISFSKVVTIAPLTRSTVSFSPADEPRLAVKNPPLWWPYQMGLPKLQKLELSFTENGSVADQSRLEFGIREV